MEIRTGTLQGKGRHLTGYAAIFGAEADLGEFVEVIQPGAFDLSRNVRALYDHQRGALLGTTRAGTLKLQQDGKGLAFALDLPDTTVGRDLAELVERGDVAGCSFGFTVPKGGDAWEKRGQKLHRTLSAIDLHEVTLTSDPAYVDTSVAIRSAGYQSAQLDSYLLWMQTV